jgi:hypothetical protein
MSLSCSDICDEVIARLLELGFHIDTDDDDHEPIWNALHQVKFVMEHDNIPPAIYNDNLMLTCTCGNTPDSDGFFPCLVDGTEVDPIPDQWPDNLYVCATCRRIYRTEPRKEVPE